MHINNFLVDGEYVKSPDTVVVHKPTDHGSGTAAQVYDTDPSSQAEWATQEPVGTNFMTVLLSKKINYIVFHTVVVYYRFLVYESNEFEI